MIGVGIVVRRAVHTMIVEGTLRMTVGEEEAVCCSLAVLDYTVAAGHRQAVGLVEAADSSDHTAAVVTMSDTEVESYIALGIVGRAVASLRRRASAI